MTQSNEEYMDEQLKDIDTESDLAKLEKLRKKQSNQTDALTKGIRKVLLYSGFIGAGISAISYLIATFVMIKGVSSDLTFQNQVLFSALGAVVGLLISFLLRSQGITYAKQNPEVHAIMSNYTKEVIKNQPEKKSHLIGWYMFWATMRDIFIKGISVGVSTYLIVYIFIEGSGNWALLWLAISNIGLFTGFGLVSLAKMYENYIEKHIPAVIDRTKRLQDKAKEKAKEKEIGKEV